MHTILFPFLLDHLLRMLASGDSSCSLREFVDCGSKACHALSANGSIDAHWLNVYAGAKTYRPHGEARDVVIRCPSAPLQVDEMFSFGIRICTKEYHTGMWSKARICALRNGAPNAQRGEAVVVSQRTATASNTPLMPACNEMYFMSLASSMISCGLQQRGLRSSVSLPLDHVVANPENFERH